MNRHQHWFTMSLSKVILCLLLAQVGADWTATCPSTCTCKWNSGKKVAECINTNFTTVPENLSPDIQVLDLRGTPLQVLVDHAFRSAGLVNLQKIHLRNCSLREVKKNAFDELSIMIEVDLSYNQLTRIHPETFAKNERLRSINLSNNPLHKLEAHQFPVLPQLRTLELVNCGLELLDKKAFMHLNALETLKLSDNRFTVLKPEVFLPLSKLRSLDLQGNPWVCDCKLLPLWDFLAEANLNSVVTTCRDPNHLAGRLWGQLAKEDLACRPTVEIADRWFEGRLGFDATFSCRVSGTPPPVVWWVLQNKIAANATLMSASDQFLIRESVIVPLRPYEEAEHWSNLTLRRVTEQDAGEYRCIARNKGGQSDINATLTIPPAPVIIIVEEDNAIPHTIIIGVAGAVTVVLISGLLFLIVCICRRHKRRVRREAQLQNGMKVANGNGTIGCKDTEQEKSLLVIEMDDFNKRPKNVDGYEAVSQTEVDSDALARGSCTYIPGEKFDDRVPDTGRDLSMNSIRDPNCSQGNHDGSFYPDLLDIPHRARGGSPSSASGASTAPDTSRLLMPLNPAQLAGHPSYASADYRTMPVGLPYHTPLHFTDSVSSTGSSATVLLPAGNRPGYVTLPRRPRPRVPSWASNPAASPSPTIDRQQPLYDTIGPRITADGSSSSALSLNKIAGLTPVAAPSPSCSIRSNPTPTRGHKISLPAYYVPIEEVDVPPPSPLVQREGGRSSTLPLSTPNIAEAGKREGRRQEPTLPYLSSPNRSADDESSPLTTSTPNSNASHTSPEILSPIVDLRTPGTRASVSSITSTGSRANCSSPRKKIPPSVAPKPVGLAKPRPVSVGGQRNSFAEAQLDPYNREKSTVVPVKVPPKPPPKPKKRISTAESDGSRLTETDSIFEDEGEDGTEV